MRGGMTLEFEPGSFEFEDSDEPEIVESPRRFKRTRSTPLDLQEPTNILKRQASAPATFAENYGIYGKDKTRLGVISSGIYDGLKDSLIDVGAEANVYKVRLSDTPWFEIAQDILPGDEYCALRDFKHPSDGDNELRALYSFQDIKQVSRILCHIQNKGNLLGVVLEYIDGQELFDKLNRGLTTSQKEKAICEISQGIRSIHSKGWAHRDIKLENVMVPSDPAKPCKIIDFGTACNSNSSESCGRGYDTTPLYNPVKSFIIKLHNGDPLPSSSVREGMTLEEGRNADIHAFGILIYILLSGRYPRHISFMGRYEDKDIPMSPYPYLLTECIPEQFRDIIVKMIGCGDDGGDGESNCSESEQGNILDQLDGLFASE